MSSSAALFVREMLRVQLAQLVVGMHYTEGLKDRVLIAGKRFIEKGYDEGDPLFVALVTEGADLEVELRWETPHGEVCYIQCRYEIYPE